MDLCLYERCVFFGGVWGLLFFRWHGRVKGLVVYKV